MTTPFFCQACGHRDEAARADCANCGAARGRNRARYISGAAFVLNELPEYPFDAVLTTDQRERIRAHYEDRLNLVLGRVQTPAPAAAPAVAPAPPPPPYAPQPRPVAQPRPEFDWSWLAEQQANLFLFAGAFLTVVAALIYVGYSGQAVSGALKMAMLVVYTLGFIGAGALCLRYERVQVAGRVFFAIGAISVPLNFVAARSIFGEGDLSAQSMWLAGSIVTAGFYTAVAYLGLGKPYAFGAGVAMASGVLAAAVVADVPVEWMPLLFIGLATAMSLISTLNDERLQSRLAVIWSYQADAIAMLAAGAALLLAPFAQQYSDSEAWEGIDSAWFLPIAFAAFTGYALMRMTSTRNPLPAVAAIVGFGAAFVSVAYAAAVPAEQFAVVLALLATTFGGIMLLSASMPQDSAAPEGFDEMLRAAAILAGGAAMLAAFIIVNQDAQSITYDVQSRWYLAVTFAALIPFYAIDAFVRRERFGASAMMVAVIGAVTSILYAVEASAEYYAFPPILAAVAFAAAARWLRHPLVERLEASWRSDALVIGYAAVASGLLVGVIAALAGASEESEFEPAYRSYLGVAFGAAAVFAAIDATQRSRIGANALALILVGLGGSVAYAIDPSAEMYAFGLFAPAIAIAAAVRFAPASRTTSLAPAWAEDTMVVARVAAGAGMAVALGALAVSEDGTPNTYEPATRWFLALSFGAAAVVAGLDASRRKHPATTGALLVALGGVALSVPYALESPAEHYAIALSGVAFAFAAGGRLYSPAWIDETVRDVVSVVAITASWLLFEGAYVDAPRVGAAIHFAAAAFYAGAALTSKSTRTLGELFNVEEAPRVPLSSGWLYAAGLTALIGYINVLRGMPAGEDAGGGSMAMPLMFAALAFAAIGAALRFWRPEFRMHLYVMALLVALFSISTGATVGVMTTVLLVYVVLFAAIAVYEDLPVLGAPAVMFGFAAVVAWRENTDAEWWTIPAAYSTIGVLLGAAAAIAGMSERRVWLAALGVAGGVFAVGAPLAGFGILESQTDIENMVDGVPFWETALYQWSTISVAVLGLLGIGAAIASGWRWAYVPATATLTVALLLQIGSWHPENAQAYTAVIGTYLVLLGLLGLWKFRLVPEAAELAPFVEALGAAVIMFPSFVQSIDAGWRYQWILLAEAVGFFALSVGLRRRGMLAASLVAMVLVAGRTLFDAVNALPNWVVVLIAGMALLGVGTAILLGRDRWSKWQEALMGWWQDAGNGHSPA